MIKIIEKKLSTVLTTLIMLLSMIAIVGQISSAPSGGEDTPTISFIYDDSDNDVTINSTDPGYYYGVNGNFTEANLVFEMVNDTYYYVLADLTVGVSGDLSTKEIETNDAISGFLDSSYEIKWLPTNTVIGNFTFTSDPPDSQLEISAPSLVVEGESFDVLVTADGDPISGAEVTFYDVVYMTDSYGSVSLTAPEVEDGNNSFTIAASKEGYVSDSATIWVLNIQDFQLVISVLSSVVEGESFDVSVTADGDSVSGVDVTFNSDVFVTDSNGSISINAPEVVNDNSFTITASKLGYVSDSVIILVINIPDSQLVISAPSSVVEGESFDVSVISNSQLVSGVDITFNSVALQSNVNGLVSFTAPAVENDLSFTIYASKEGYLSDTATIVVLDFSTPSISFVYNDWSKAIIIITADSGHHYSESNSSSDANLIFKTDSITYYVGTNLTITTSEPLSTKEIEPGDTISGFVNPGNYSIIWNPTGAILRIFYVSEQQPEPYVIYGTVLGRFSNNSTTPLQNASVGIRLIEDPPLDETQQWHVVFTDENGNYITKTALPGLYEIKASKEGYTSSTKNIEISKDQNQSNIVNFILDKGTVHETPSYFYDEIIIDEAIKMGNVGGEIFIRQIENQYDPEILIFNGVSILELNVQLGIVSFIVSGAENITGKTIAITIDPGVFDPNQELFIEYDGENIKMADDINDILNPNDDGSHPEYLIAIGAEGTQILISIPHFSEHAITIFSLTSEEIVQFLEIAVIAAFIIIGIASFAMFRKGKED